MERAGVIEPSTSPWSSPVVIAKKKDGRPRFCIDFRKVNEVTEKDAYPLPQVEATLDKLRGAKYLSTIDLKNGYWQVPLASGSRPITAFTVPGRGLMQFRVMPFGLHSAPATFQRLLDTRIRLPRRHYRRKPNTRRSLMPPKGGIHPPPPCPVKNQSREMPLWSQTAPISRTSDHSGRHQHRPGENRGRHAHPSTTRHTRSPSVPGSTFLVPTVHRKLFGTRPTTHATDQQEN